MTRITEDIKEKILAEYYKGCIVKSLVSRYGISKTTLYTWLRKNRYILTTNNEKITLAEYNEIKKSLERKTLELEILKELCNFDNYSIADKEIAVDRLFDKYPIKLACKLIGLNHSTFYNYHFRKVKYSDYQKHNDELKEWILKLYKESGERFSSNKIFQKLQQLGVPCSLDKIVVLFNELGLKKKRTKKIRKRDAKIPKYFTKNNLLKQEFNHESPNVFWVGDVSEFKIHNVRFYICVVMDLFSRKIIAHRLSSQNNNSLTVNTFKDAFEFRGRPSHLSFHSDQGCNYTSQEYSSLLHSLKVKQSFSKRACPYDNSAIEAFFSNLKQDDLYTKEFEYFDDLVLAVGEYVNYYNDYRPHKSLYNRTPNEHESFYLKQIYA